MFEIKLSEFLPRGYDKVTLTIALAIFIIIFGITLTIMKEAGRGKCDEGFCFYSILHPGVSFVLGVTSLLLIWKDLIDKDDIGYVIAVAVILLFAVTQVIALLTYPPKHK